MDYSIEDIRRSQLNGDIWECREKAITRGSGSPNIMGSYYRSPGRWMKFTLGMGFREDHEYRKVSTWYVYRDSITGKFNKTDTGHEGISKIEFSGTEEECAKWIQDNTKTWLDATFPNGEGQCKLERYGITEFVNVLKEEVSKNLVQKDCCGMPVSYIAESDLNDIIKDLGVSL